MMVDLCCAGGLETGSITEIYGEHHIHLVVARAFTLFSAVLMLACWFLAGRGISMWENAAVSHALCNMPGTLLCFCSRAAKAFFAVVVYACWPVMNLNGKNSDAAAD